MNKTAVIAIVCFVLGALVGAAITYEFTHCKTNEMIFQLKEPTE